MRIHLLLIGLCGQPAELQSGWLNQTRRKEYRSAGPRVRPHRGCRDDAVALEIQLSAEATDQAEMLHAQLACADGAKGFARLRRWVSLAVQGCFHFVCQLPVFLEANWVTDGNPEGLPVNQ